MEEIAYADAVELESSVMIRESLDRESRRRKTVQIMLARMKDAVTTFGAMSSGFIEAESGLRLFAGKLREWKKQNDSDPTCLDSPDELDLDLMTDVLTQGADEIRKQFALARRVLVGEQMVNSSIAETYANGGYDVKEYKIKSDGEAELIDTKPGGE